MSLKVKYEIFEIHCFNLRNNNFPSQEFLFWILFDKETHAFSG